LSIIAAILILVTFAAYKDVRHNAFINFDDDIYVTENQIVKEGLTLKGISWALDFNQRGYWQPLTWLSHMVDCELFGLNPAGHHLTNMMIHLANALLLFWTLYKMTGKLYPSALVAAFFALHPLNVDSVAWIAERKNLLSTFFWMLSMLSYNRYAKNPKPDRYLLTLILFTLGLMVKPMLVTLPFVLLLLDFWPLKRLKYGQRQGYGPKEPQVLNSKNQHRDAYRLIIEKIPFFAISCGSVWLSILSAQHINSMIAADTVPLTLRISNALVSYVGYIGKTIWPFELAVYYPFPENLPLWQIAGSGVLLVSVTAVVIMKIHRIPYLGLGWFWYIGTLVPVIGVVQTGLWPAMADRWAYVPLIGLFIIMSWGVFDVARKWQFGKLVTFGIAIAVLAGLFISTRVQLQYWKNSRALFEHALAATAGNAVAHNNLANALLDEGKAEDAIGHYRSALKIDPNFAKAHMNLGNAFMNVGSIEEAVEHYFVSIRIDPLVAKAHNNLAVAFSAQGRLSDSLSHLQEALRLDPNYADAYNNLGAVYRKQGRVERAAKCYLEAIRLRPDFAEAYNNLGLLLAREGKPKVAVIYFRKALQIKSDYSEARENLEKSQTGIDEFTAKVSQIKGKIILSPENSSLYLKLGNLYKRHGELAEAIAQYQKALSIQPDLQPAIHNLAVACAMKGRYDKAVHLLQKMITYQPDNAELYYYLAGIFSRQNKVDQSILFLKKAVAKGFQNWQKLKNDRNFKNISGTSYYKSLLKGSSG